MMGHSAWNKGLKGFRAGQRKLRTQLYCIICKGKIKLLYPSLKRKTCSPICETTLKKTYVGKKCWNWIEIPLVKCPTCKLNFRPQRGAKKHCSKPCVIKARIGEKQSKSTIQKRLHRRPMSSLEIKMQQIIQDNNLPYKFVGNGKFFIDNINPDFVNINGEKKAIEVYYKQHKEQFSNGGYLGWKERREKICKEYGWNMLFFDVIQVNNQNVIDVLGRDG